MFGGTVALVLVGVAIAGEPPPAAPDFSPPPVPEFMLRKPQKPLTLEEMQRQADDAAARVRARRELVPPSVEHPARQQAPQLPEPPQ